MDMRDGQEQSDLNGEPIDCVKKYLCLGDVTGTGNSADAGEVARYRKL